MNERVPTIYEVLARKKMIVAATQINILNYYDSSKEKVRMQQLYDLSHEAIIESQSEDAVDKIDTLIDEFQATISKYRRVNPQLENYSPDLKKKLGRLERKLTE
tara:strand:+ start:108 stop:419 length:312 start_codon:yes stop_codon:yes gene_type:complete